MYDEKSVLCVSACFDAGVPALCICAGADDRHRHGRQGVHVHGGEGTYQADGKTFIIGADAVIVQEPGFPDRTLELVRTQDTAILLDGRDGHPAAAGQETDDSIIIREGTAAYEAAEAIAVYTQYSYSYPENDEAWARRFEPYAEYGLSCDPESRTLMVQGQRVRSFTDAYPVSGGVCTIIEYTDEQGTIDLQTERDQTRADSPCGWLVQPRGPAHRNPRAGRGRVC